MCDRRAYVPKPGRIPCLVMGCRRTAPQEKYPPNTEIICHKCWMLAPKHLRRRVRKLERIMKRRGITHEHWPPPGSIDRRVLVMHYKTWQRIRHAVIEARVGIG